MKFPTTKTMIPGLRISWRRDGRDMLHAASIGILAGVAIGCLCALLALIGGLR
jgi:hypothetical protein